MKTKSRAYSMEVEYANWSKGRRTGILGKEDVFSTAKIQIVSKPLYIECKEREDTKGLKGLIKWYNQAEKNSNNGVPILAFHRLNSRYDEDFIIIKRKYVEVIS